MDIRSQKMVASVWLRGTLRVSQKLSGSRFFCQFAKHGKSVFNTLQSSSNRGCLRLQSKRSCFGPGVSNMAREAINKGNAKTKDQHFGPKVVDIFLWTFKPFSLIKLKVEF